MKEANSHVKYSATIFSGIIAALLISSFVSQAQAADLAAFLVPERDRSEASYIGVKTVTLQYPAGSSLAQELNGKNERIAFAINGTAGGEDANGMSGLINAVNRAFVDAQSTVQIQFAELDYRAIIRGGPESAVISYRVELAPTLEKFVLARESSGDIVDLEWRGLVVQEPLVVRPQEITATPSDLEIAEIDVNHPIGLLQALYPTIAGKLVNTPASEVLEDPILNFAVFNAPMESWHVLFDPVGAYGTSVGLQGTEGAQALSVYSFGESSLREGTHEAEEKEATATVDGSQILVKSSTAPPNSQITIAGYADAQGDAGGEFAVVTIDAPEGVQTATGGFPIQVLLVLGGLMGAIAVFVLWKARK